MRYLTKNNVFNAIGAKSAVLNLQTANPLLTSVYNTHKQWKKF